MLFNFYALIGIVYSLALNLTHGFAKLKNHAAVLGPDSPIDMTFVDFLQALCIFLEIAFGLFIMVVFCDQISIILNRLTVLDRVKLYDNRLESVKRRGYKNFQVTFGGPISLWWLVPTPVKGTFDIEELYY